MDALRAAALCWAEDRRQCPECAGPLTMRYHDRASEMDSGWCPACHFQFGGRERDEARGVDPEEILSAAHQALRECSRDVPKARKYELTQIMARYAPMPRGLTEAEKRFYQAKSAYLYALSEREPPLKPDGSLDVAEDDSDLDIQRVE